MFWAAVLKRFRRSLDTSGQHRKRLWTQKVTKVLDLLAPFTERSLAKPKKIEMPDFVKEKLDKLELNHNKIEELVDYSFEGLPKLTSLSVDYNKIRNVQERAFSGLDGNN